MAGRTWALAQAKVRVDEVVAKLKDIKGKAEQALKQVRRCPAPPTCATTVRHQLRLLGGAEASHAAGCEPCARARSMHEHRAAAGMHPAPPRPTLTPNLKP